MSIFIAQSFAQIQCKQSSLVVTSTNANIVQTSKKLLQNKNRLQRFQKPFSVVFAVSKAPWTVKSRSPTLQ